MINYYKIKDYNCCSLISSHFLTNILLILQMSIKELGSSPIKTYFFKENVSLHTRFLLRFLTLTSDKSNSTKSCYFNNVLICAQRKRLNRNIFISFNPLILKYFYP